MNKPKLVIMQYFNQMSLFNEIDCIPETLKQVQGDGVVWGWWKTEVLTLKVS